MVGLLYFPKSPSMDSLLQQQPMNSRVSSSSSSNLNNHHHQQQCFLTLTKLQLKPMLSNLVFRPRQWSRTQCTWVNSPTSSEAENGTLVSFFGELGIDEKETKALLVKNSAISVKSLRSRVLSLSSLGIEDSKISLIISKKPSIVTSEEVDPFVAFVLVELGGEIKASQLERLFLTLDPSLLSGFDRKVNLLVERGIPRDKITRVLNSVNLSKAICSKSLEELDETIAFLTRFGGVDLLVKRPTLLNYPLETHLVPRIGFFSKLIGGDEASVGAVLGKLPAVLNYSVRHFESHAEFFRSTLGLTDEEVFKLVLAYPNVFSASRARKLAPRTQFLRDCGLGSEEIFKFLMRAPLFVSLSFDDNIVHKLALLVKIGYEPRTRELAAAMGSVTRTSCRNMLDVIGVFLSHGFSCEDVLTMSKRHPQILQYGHESLDEKMEYLFGEMGRGIDELLAFPAYLGYKLDERIKARYESRKNTSREGMSINKLLTVSSERFSKRKKKTFDSDEIL